MPEGAFIEIEGLDKLIKKLDKIGKLDYVKAGIKAGAVYVKGKIAKYPPPTAINKPGNPSGRWYVRGFGWRFASGRVSPVSEDLGGGWTIKTEDRGFTAIVGNDTSYGIFVQGPKDGPKGQRQAGHMARIGWKSVDTVAEEEKKRVQEYVFDAVRRAIGA